MSIIEPADLRLEQLKRAGIEPSRDSGPAAAPAAQPGASLPEQIVAAHAQGQAANKREPSRAAAAPEAVPLASPKASAQSRTISIDLERLTALGYVTGDSSRSQIAEEFRVIKRPILHNVQGKSAGKVEKANLVMVTSAMPGEGKTFTSLNLALSLATELDHTVLLVDADVAKPSLLRTLGIKSSKGLLDVLTADTLQLSDVLLRTNIEKLAILPAGTAHRRATELLASEAMSHLLDEMAARYGDRIIVFDSPPLLPTTEARVIATQMGQVVVVIEADHTNQSAVKHMMRALEDCPVVMTVLNKAVRSEVGSYYAGYYGQDEVPA